MEQQEKANTETDEAAGMDAKIETNMDVGDTPARDAARARRGRPFERGRSGNPSGRPKGHRNKATMAIEELLDGEAEGLARKVIDKALEGDMAALRLCLERLLPGAARTAPHLRPAQDRIRQGCPGGFIRNSGRLRGR
jgi:hypothetical protein